jgi:hypothetical protein
MQLPASFKTNQVRIMILAGVADGMMGLRATHNKYRDTGTWISVHHPDSVTMSIATQTKERLACAGSQNAGETLNNWTGGVEPMRPTFEG